METVSTLGSVVQFARIGANSLIRRVEAQGVPFGAFFSCVPLLLWDSFQTQSLRFYICPSTKATQNSHVQIAEPLDTRAIQTPAHAADGTSGETTVETPTMVSARG